MKAKTIVLTGASGGIGTAIASELAKQGHQLIMAGRNNSALNRLCATLPSPESHVVVVADLVQPEGRACLVEACREQGGVDVLINNAGISNFALLEDSSDQQLAAMMNINLLAPILLIRDVLQGARKDNLTIINIGSTFGSIGYPGFSGYCASKFGLRGFSEALRREYAGQNVSVHYLAPRAVNTEMNSDAVRKLNQELGNAVDSPERVALACLDLLSKEQGRNRYIGWPERFFVKLNVLFPSLVDRALRKQLSTIYKYCRQTVSP